MYRIGRWRSCFRSARHGERAFTAGLVGVPAGLGLRERDCRGVRTDGFGVYNVVPVCRKSKKNINCDVGVRRGGGRASRKC